MCILNVRTEQVVNNIEKPLYRLLTNKQDYVKLYGGITQGTMKLHYFITVNINELTRLYIFIYNAQLTTTKLIILKS